MVAPHQFTYRKEDKIAIAKNARLAWSEPPPVDLRDDSDGEEGKRRNNAPRSRSPNEDPECALPPGHPRASCRTTILARIVHFSCTSAAACDQELTKEFGVQHNIAPGVASDTILSLRSVQVYGRDLSIAVGRRQ